MATFIANIQLQNAGEVDYEALSLRLKEKSFKALAAVKKKGRTKILAPLTVTFSKNGSLQPIVSEIMDAARKTGKAFSFNVIRNKAN